MSESQKKEPTVLDLLGSSLFDPAHLEEQIRKEQEVYQQFMEDLKQAHERGEGISKYVWPCEWD